MVKSFLSRVVDGIDSYFFKLSRKPSCCNDKIKSLIDSNGHKVLLKVETVGEYLKIDPVLLALTRLMIIYRNNVVHFSSDQVLDESVKQTLVTNKTIIRDVYRGLDIERLFLDISSDFLTFKEAASFISIANKFIEAVDARIISELDIAAWYREVINDQLKQNKGLCNKLRSLPNSKEKIINSLRNILINYSGISREDLAGFDFGTLIPKLEIFKNVD